MFKPKFKLTAGLDIGSHSIKYVEVLSGKSLIKLQKAATLPLPLGTTQSTALKTFYEANPAAPKSVRISISGPQVVIRRITLPIMTHSDLKGAIRFEAENHLPFTVDECVLDFQILNQVPNQTMMNVLLVAAKRDFIQEKLDLLNVVNLQPEIIDLDVFCVANAFQMLNSTAENKIYGLLNVGHQISTFAVIQDKQPFFARDISHGGLGVTNALSELKGIPTGEAEILKLGREAAALNDLKAATQKAFEPLIDELKNSIDFCEGELGEPVPLIWLSGGGAQSYETAKILSEAVGKPVSTWDNTKKMEIFKNVDLKFLEAHAGEFNVAFGMALRGAGALK
ncbi:MAG: hypothetical protein AUJ72_03505 [Candidatus Omnitrophica bacterium CG1_02_46_14]|nr:MAG: hypothetical protein AUJ72_03505 [Candidatus Omnitrophica bacterium CG1_02_46_14]